MGLDIYIYRRKRGEVKKECIASFERESLLLQVLLEYSDYCISGDDPEILVDKVNEYFPISKKLLDRLFHGCDCLIGYCDNKPLDKVINYPEVRRLGYLLREDIKEDNLESILKMAKKVFNELGEKLKEDYDYFFTYQY